MSYLQSAKVFPQNTITKILSNITSGVISKHFDNGRDLEYTFYALATGSGSPTQKKFDSNAIRLFKDGEEQSVIDSDTAIDIYVYAVSKSDIKNDDKGWLIISVDN